MSESENGGNSNEQRSVSSPGRVLGARSASPAKRSASDMEDAGNAANEAGQELKETVPGSFPEQQTGGQSDFDAAMAGMPDASNGADTQETSADSFNTSTQGTVTANTSATSLQSDVLPPYSEEDKWKKGSSRHSDNSLPSIDEQVNQVREIVRSSPLDEGTQGFVVSSKWLARVMARSSENLGKPEFAKEAREGPIGPMDNSDIVPEGASSSELHDNARPSRKFIPLKPGLTMGEDFEVIPDKARGLICGWYGHSHGPDPIVRYAHNTAEPPAQNIVYENYPPIFTIRKVPQPGQQAERPPSPSGPSADALRKRKEQRARGQTSPDDALRLVSSRSERFKDFLTRAKEAAGIPRATKVRLWRVLNPQNVAVDKPEDAEQGILSPPQSRGASPSKAAQPTASNLKLVLPPAEFKAMDIGKHLEHIDAKDETNNDKYNGTSTVQTFGMYEDQIILLEEQIGGPAGGEFQSDGKKPKLSLGASKTGSRPGSTTASGRTSPTPGGMLTRGRARRDGRTRGTVGLSNLGNTCYMNSALQCLRSVEELALYFLSDRYKSDINTGNPLGHGGAMAKHYAGVLQGIYSPNASGAFTPSAFKKSLGSIQPLFSGYQQQDSQEFLSFLVDALHEDLNRVLKKPYNENPDSDDSTVHDKQAIIDLGETYRANHKARNDSVAMDLFSGFYKNTMECPVCEKISITFDPYSSLTVQLPVESTFQHTVTFVPLNGAPINHAIDMDKNASIKTLKDNIASKHNGVTGDRLWMVEVYSNKIYKVFENQQTLAEAGVQSNDYLFVYELPAVPTNVPETSAKKAYYPIYGNYNSSHDKEAVSMDSKKGDTFAVPVFSRQKNRFGNGWEMIMHPLYITVTRDEAQDFDTVLKKVLVAVSRITSRPILTELDENKDETPAEPNTNGEAEKDESAGEDAGRVSDRSVPSEDGYVDVSIDKPAQGSATEETKNAETQPMQGSSAIPARFMDPQYFISPALRNHLFEVKWAKSAEGPHCTGMQSIADKDVRNMFERVKQPIRRASVQSSTSDESTTSTGSGQANGETEESDADDDENKPDIRLGMEDAMHVQTPTSAEAGSDDELLEDPITSFRNPRRRTGKKDKYQKNRKVQTYGKKGGKGGRGHQQRPTSSGSLRSTQSQRSLTGKPPVEDENPYYIKLGEGIVLDWHAEGLDALFGAGKNAEDVMRGHWLSSADGKNLDFVPDAALQAKRDQRLARKKNGITLQDCFVETGKREILSEDNAWYCSRCKERRQAAKTLEIWTIPDILIVHLKRFGGNRSFRDKIDVLVDYPIEGLDLTEKVGLKEDGKEYVYDLFAVDNHYGGLGGGHYTAIAKNFYDGQWYDYNDSSCTKIGEAKMHSAAAYLLFYRRRSEMPLGSQIIQDIVNEARNPPQTESTGEDAEELESGEGRLGGPTSSLHGSPSALVAAGAATSASLRSIANGSAGAGSSLIRKPMTTSQSEHGDGDDEADSPLGTLNGKPILGPERPPQSLQYGTQGSSWGFDALDQPAEADDGATDRLLGTIDDDDNNSTTAELDNDSAYGDGDGYGSRLQDSFHGGAFEDASEEFDTRVSSGYGGRNTPVEGFNTEFGNDYDDHAMYSDAHERQNADVDALHLEDAGMVGGDAESPPAHEIHVDEDMGADSHGKMD